MLYVDLLKKDICQMMIIWNDGELSPNLLKLTNAFCAGDLTGGKDACLVSSME